VDIPGRTGESTSTPLQNFFSGRLTAGSLLNQLIFSSKEL